MGRWIELDVLIGLHIKWLAYYTGWNDEIVALEKTT